MVELIITEKPSAAKKVAEALADGRPVKKKSKKSSYYELKHGRSKIFVTSAVGHLYGLVEKNKKGWNYPVFDIKWEANYKTSENMAYVKDYVDTIETLSKKADKFIIACDYDVEGEVIGWNVIRYACKQKDANRMKFSTLTKVDLIEAYEKKLKHLDWGQARAGETRHKLDWYYGINLSRALTSSVKAAGSFKVMSAGRVQGPALKLLVDRERDIKKFISKPFWEIVLEGRYKSSTVESQHIKGKIFDKKVVTKILSKVRGGKTAKITNVKRKQREQMPPHPFDLTSLQSESYGQFKITPKETLALAQRLYLAGLTSYPRTSSQELDPKLGFKKILKNLRKQKSYEKFCQELLELKELKPNNGKKTDPAHPAIYPTGVTPKVLKPHEKKLYDLIVKRFFATFAQPAVRETMEVVLDVNKEEFITKGTRTLVENWHRFYQPYVKVEEVTLPDMKIDEEVKVKKINKIDKETQPPNRYNQSSIIKELEKRNLGTKATRADILHRLFERGYIEGVQITVTNLGMETIIILEKYAPLIVDQKLTAEIEEDMEQIRQGKEKSKEVLEKTQKFLTKLLAGFKKKEKEIGTELLESIRKTRKEESFVGKCNKCSRGKLEIRRGKFGRFIACNKYPKCKNTFKVPKTGMVKHSNHPCKVCDYPMIKHIQKGKRPREFCINPDCKSKVSVGEKTEIKKIESHKIEKKCPDCGKELVVRSSFYGNFLGCSSYPKCRHTENLEHHKKFEKKEKKVKKKEVKKK